MNENAFVAEKPGRLQITQVHVANCDCVCLLAFWNLIILKKSSILWAEPTHIWNKLMFCKIQWSWNYHSIAVSFVPLFSDWADVPNRSASKTMAKICRQHNGDWVSTTYPIWLSHTKGQTTFNLLLTGSSGHHSVWHLIRPSCSEALLLANRALGIWHLSLSLLALTTFCLVSFLPFVWLSFVNWFSWANWLQEDSTMKHFCSKVTVWCFDWPLIFGILVFVSKVDKWISALESISPE